jgi:hypothetical protein
MRYLFSIMILLCSCATVRADDGGVRGVGGAVELLWPEHPSIRMVRETVNATNLSTVRYQPHVRCVFVFKNEGKATTVEMGFPEMSGGEGRPTEPGESGLMGFKSWVDGKLVKTRLEPSKDNGDQTFEAWHVKNVHFAAGQTRTIIDEYRGGMGGDSGGAASFRYTLISGASWKGKIGEADITVDTSAMPKSKKIQSIRPKGYVRRGSVIKWHFTNLEPKEDVSIEFVPVFSLSINGGLDFYVVYRQDHGITLGYATLLGQQMGSVEVDVRGRECVFTHEKHVLKLTAGSRVAVLDRNRKAILPKAPFRVHKDMIVPIAAVSRLLGAKVQHGWAHGEYFLTIDEPTD